MNGVEIKQLRLKLGMTQARFAQEIGVNHSTMNKWEMGKHKPSPMALRKMQSMIKKNKGINVN